jgi:hypothetical protein
MSLMKNGLSIEKRQIQSNSVAEPDEAPKGADS